MASLLVWISQVIEIKNLMCHNVVSVKYVISGVILRVFLGIQCTALDEPGNGHAKVL